MIVSAPTDFEATARHRLPPFLYHYVAGGANVERTLKRNVDDLSDIALRQRVLKNVTEITTDIEIFGERWAVPFGIAPVGLTGMYARRGEAQVARAASTREIPFTLSTVSVCSLEEVRSAADRPPWFQLYVLKDRAFMRDMLERAQAASVGVLVFTVDMPVPGIRYRDAHSGMSGRCAGLRRILQGISHPHWAWDVGLRGRPHDLGNVSAYKHERLTLQDYVGWLGANFDPSVCWHDLEWIRNAWSGPLVVKGILDPEDARQALNVGADGIVVSNHGGRQLDGVVSTCRALPAIADTVSGRMTVLVDSGVRSGLDIVRMIALGANGVLLGRPFVYALATAGESGVLKLIDLLTTELRVAMALTGASTIAQLSRDNLLP